MGRDTSYFYPRGSPNTPLSSGSCMSQACEHTWYTEGIIFHYIRLGSVVEVERSSGLSRKFREVLSFICFVKVLLLRYKLLLTFLYKGVVVWLLVVYCDNATFLHKGVVVQLLVIL